MGKNELTNMIHATLCPRAVLIAYTYEGDKKYFLEQRSIDGKGKMGEGHPVTVEFMELFGDTRQYAIRQAAVQPSVCRFPQRKRKIHLV